MIEWLNGKIAELEALLQGGSTIAAIAIVALTYWKTRALVALLVSGLTAGVFLWTIHNADWWQDRVGDETEPGTGAGVVVDEGALPTLHDETVPGDEVVVVGEWAG